MRIIYRFLLQLYPREYRTLFGTEMLKAFEQASEEFRRRGISLFLRFALVEFGDLMTEAPVEWAAKLKHTLCHARPGAGCRCLPDIAKARPPWVARAAYSAELARVLNANEHGSDRCTSDILP